MSSEFWSTLNKKKREELLKTAQTKASSSNREEITTGDFWSVLNEDKKRELLSSATTDIAPTRTFMQDDDDIAPVKGGNKNSVFKSGGFSDGVDGVGDFFGDLGQTVLGTTADLGLGILKGAGRLVEGVVDLGTYGVAGVADLFGADKFAEKTKKVAQYSATDEWTKGATDYVDQYSVLGNKADMVSEGLGQVLGIVATGGAAGAAGLGTAGATALTTGLTGLSGMGSGMNDAYAMGASDGNAVAYGATVGSLEAVSEMIFGGLGKGFKALGVSKGLTSIDDVFAKKLSNAAAKFITSEAGQKVVGNTLEYAVKSGAEGLEEVISGFGSAIAKDAYLMNGKDEKAFGEILEDENLLEQFVVGSIVSGIAQGGDFISSTKNGRDFVSGLSKNEQTVVDKVYEQRLAEESENQTLSNRDKNKLYERVVEEMKRGYVSTDEIESILGGETYKGYKDLTDKKKSLEERKKAIEGEIKAINDEIKDIIQTPELQFTVEQRETVTSLREKTTALREEAKGIKEALQNLGIKTAKNNLFNEVNKLTAKDAFLRESYNDLIRQNQALQIDENQYNGTKFADAAKKTIENARKAKASNSIRVRDFVEFSAKYSSVSGTVVDFKDANQINKILEDQLNAKITTLQKSTTEEDKTKLAEIQDMLKQVQEGEIHVNGVKTKDGVAINLKSPNYLNVVLGHEVTHFLEGKNAYEPLQKAIFKFAKTKGDYEGRRKVLDVLYKNVEGTTVDYELTADLVGDYLFTEYDFIKSLSTENRNVFQYVFDQIKYVYKLATAGSKEARELEKVMHQFERALRESAETSQNAEHNGIGEDKTQFSMTGDKSKLNNKSSLEKAKTMLEQGENSETIRQATNWVKSYDGEWRFEIDDSNSKFMLPKMIESAKAKAQAKVDKLTADYKAGKIGKTAYENKIYHAKWQAETSTLMRSFVNGRYTLGQILKHPKLYAAYPELKDVTVRFDRLGEGVRGSTSGAYSPIVLHENSYYRPDETYSTLLHEVQHQIQEIEGFASGASPEYWQSQRQDIVDTIRGARENLDLWLDDIGYSDFVESSMREVANKEKTLEQHWKDLQEFKDSSKYAKQIAACEAELAEYQHQYDEITNGMTAFEQYQNTAGEIEARDTANRLNLNAKERKNTRPDIDRSDVVFAEGGTASYALKHDKNGNKYWEIDSGKDIFKGLNTPEEYREAAFKYLIANRDNKVTVKDKSGNDIVFIRLSAEEFTHSDESNELFENNPEMFNQKMRLAPSLEDILMNANVNWHSPDHKNHKLFKEKGFENYRGKVRIDNVIFNSIVRVGKAKFGDVFYDINLEVDSYLPHTKSDASDINESTSIEDIIAPLPENVNTQFSLSVDSKGNELSPAVQKRFANSKVRDENGKLKVMYHGSPETFTVFDKSKAKASGYYGKGFYFTDSDSHAKQYGNTYDVYLNITNPIHDGTNNITKDQLRKFVEAVAENEDYGIDNYGYGATVDSVTNSVYGKSDFAMLMDVNASCVGDMVAAIELFNEVNGTDYNGIITPTETVAFYPEQIKRTDNKKPTDNPDIRYSLSPDKKKADADYMFAVKNGDTETAQRMVDEAAKNAGYTPEHLYHGTSGFGFTKIDTNLSDDGISFFVADKVEVAQGYFPYYENDSDEYHDSVRVIGKASDRAKAPINEKLDIADVIAKVKEAMPDKYGSAKPATEQDVISYLNKYWIPDAASAANELKNYSIPQNVEALVDSVIEADSEGTYEAWKAVAERYKEFDDIHSIYYNGALFPQASSLWHKVQSAIQMANKALKPGAVYNNGEIIGKNFLVEQYNDFLDGEGNGVYDLYANHSNQLVIRGRGSNWNNLPLGEATADFNDWWVNEEGHEPSVSGQWYRADTRSIAKYAKARGYRSVCFEDIYDAGAYGDRSEISTVYAFFNPSEDIKSADTITYDDNGNVIPLSERFNAENEDIRYSLSNEGENRTLGGSYHFEGKDFRVKSDDDIVPVGDGVANNATVPKSTRIADGTRGDELLAESLDNYPMQTIEQKIAEKIRATEGELTDNRDLRKEADANYESQIAKLRAEYNSKKNKNTKVAYGLLQSISRLERLKASTDAQFAKRISDLEARVEKMKEPKYTRAMRRQAKMAEHAKFAADLLGDTSTWKDKKLGLQYATNTERRNLRDIVRDENGNIDIARADAINDALNGQYNREEADRQRELAQVRKKYADLKITKAEDEYIQMLGELRHNPETELSPQTVNEYLEKHKDKIDEAKVDKVIELARQDYDNFIIRVNEALRAQGMREIPYRQGYFPHFVNPKQNFIQKLFNWKTQDNEIPTSIAGLTEEFKPVKSWQSFDKKRHGDKTDYSFMKGFDAYSNGVLDWIYHLDTIQKRRAVENHIRSTHSDEGITKRIKEVYANEEYDANEAQAQIEQILSEANNPLNNFVQDFMTHTNILTNKKNSLDRTTEQMTNRKIYSVMQNVQNRTSANMVLANVRSALTNFIPITQSWAQVSPLRSLQATKDTIANAIKDDGLINKSTFLTNRLREADNLYKTNWDKVLDKAGIMFEIVDNFSSQVIWRSKYNQNLSNGMSEAEAIANADQFAENVMAGRSKGNEPTLFNAKNPLVKAFTMFQLEVNNQYGYLFKDVPNDLKAETNHWKLNLAKGYTTAFIGAYVYNALLEKVAGSGAALDPIGIIEELLKDLGLFGDDEEEEPDKVITNLIENVGGELPFVGGTLFGGGRIPISSALPYGDNGLAGGVSDFVADVTEGNWKNVGKEMMNPILNVGLPVGGGQLKKTVQGLNMFSDEHPISGSYTDSGNLRFPVEDTPWNRIQAGIFGQYASKNAREYFDNDYAPLKEKQIQEYMDVDLPIGDYWKYREGLKGLKTQAEKADYINSLDIADWQKNLLMNNILDRKEDVDMSNYDDYSDWEEFDYAQKNPDKYAFAKSVGGYSAYKTYSDELYDIKADKDEYGKSISGSRKEKVLNYINNLDADYETKIILWKSEYPSDDTYNMDIINYLNNRADLTYEERVAILTELGFTVSGDTVYWD